MDYGTHPTDLYRVWNIKAQSYVRGIVGTRKHVRDEFNDWYINEIAAFRSGLITYEDALHKLKRQREYRIVRVRISIAEDISGNMTAIVL